MGNVKEFGVGAENLGAKDLIAIARLAERLGFGTYWIPEDPFYPGAFTLASAIASHAQSLRIGIGVVNPYTRHPVLTAMELGALEAVSGARTVLALGASLKSFIEGRFNIPYTKPNQSLRESVDIIRRLFRGEHLSYNGQVFRTSDVSLNFKPPRSNVPIYLGVVGPQNLELAGEIADGLLLSIMASPAYVQYAMEHVRVGAKRAGRTLEQFEIGAYFLVSISEEASAAREGLKPAIATLISLIGESPLFTCAGLESGEIKKFIATFAGGEVPVNLVEDWMIDTFAIAGTPEHCRRVLARLVDAGVTHPVAFDVFGESAERTLRDVERHLMPFFL